MTETRCTYIPLMHYPSFSSDPTARKCWFCAQLVNPAKLAYIARPIVLRVVKNSFAIFFIKKYRLWNLVQHQPDPANFGSDEIPDWRMTDSAPKNRLQLYGLQGVIRRASGRWRGWTLWAFLWSFVSLPFQPSNAKQSGHERAEHRQHNDLESAKKRCQIMIGISSSPHARENLACESHLRILSWKPPSTLLAPLEHTNLWSHDHTRPTKLKMMDWHSRNQKDSNFPEKTETECSVCPGLPLPRRKMVDNFDSQWPNTSKINGFANVGRVNDSLWQKVMWHFSLKLNLVAVQNDGTQFFCWFSQ